MSYKGHVRNGVIVLDDPVPFDEGTEVWVESAVSPGSDQTPLRGLPYVFEDPFTPVVAEGEWESAQ